VTAPGGPIFLTALKSFLAKHQRRLTLPIRARASDSYREQPSPKRTAQPAGAKDKRGLFKVGTAWRELQSEVAVDPNVGVII
jgi:hypothetical protein